MSPVIGHRGVASLAPENTIAGIKKAAELGLEWIELDVTLLGDGSPVIFHDPRLQRTTSGRGYINNISAEEAFQLDAGSWFSAEYTGEQIPSLVNALEHIKKAGIGLNLELKPNRCDQALLVKKVLETLKLSAFSEDKLLVSSFSFDSLMLFRSQSLHQIGCLFELLPKDWQQQAEQLKAVSIHLNGDKLTEKKALQVKEAGYALYCYTVNDMEKASDLISWQVDGIFSDFPQRFEIR